VGLITGLVTLPLAPVRATVWIAERLLDEAERELNDPALLEQRLDEAEAALARGELTEGEFELIEDEIVRRLIERGGM
jgi:hypothetical protein